MNKKRLIRNPLGKYTERGSCVPASAYWPLLSVDEDLAPGDVHPVPGQSQTQLVGGRRVSTWEGRGRAEQRDGG